MMLTCSEPLDTVAEYIAQAVEDHVPQIVSYLHRPFSDNTPGFTIEAFRGSDVYQKVMEANGQAAQIFSEEVFLELVQELYGDETHALLSQYMAMPAMEGARLVLNGEALLVCGSHTNLSLRPYCPILGMP